MDSTPTRSRAFRNFSRRIRPMTTPTTRSTGSASAITIKRTGSSRAGSGAGAGSGSTGFVVTDEDDTPSVYGMDNSDDTSPADGDSSAPRSVGDVPPTHVVKKGDTLWDICRTYFNNPWQWPKV